MRSPRPLSPVATAVVVVALSGGSARALECGVTGVLLRLNPSGDRNVGNIIRANTVRGGQFGVEIEATNRKTRVLDNVLFDQTLAHIVDDGLLTTLHGNVCWPGSC